MDDLKSMIWVFALAAALTLDSFHLGAHSSQPQSNPILMNTCLITTNVDRLVNFYQAVLEMKAERSGNQYAEFNTGVGVLAIFAADAQEKYIPGSTDAASNKSAILEFKVTDVDREYARLQRFVAIWVKPPTTQPWGTRSVYFRDPDGNLVNFFTPPKTQ